MNQHFKYSVRLLVILFAAFGVACGKKKMRSDDALMEINPERPIVITGSITIGPPDSGIVIKGPWFKFTVSMDNQTDEMITIVSVTSKVSGMDESGSFKDTETTFDPSSNNYSTLNYNCVYHSYGSFVVNNSKIPSTLDDSLFLSNENNPAGCSYGTITFYAPDNPSSNTGAYTYHGKFKILGWFGTYDDPTDRFEKVINFTTQ
jgi:hypothetical protein